MVAGKTSEPELLKDHLGDPEQLRESVQEHRLPTGLVNSSETAGLSTFSIL